LPSAIPAASKATQATATAARFKKPVFIATPPRTMTGNSRRLAHPAKQATPGSSDIVGKRRSRIAGRMTATENLRGNSGFH
jgi:hypothetical protein